MTREIIRWSDRKNSPGWYVDESGCHIWVGGRAGSGYGGVRWNGRQTTAHRARYEREVGPVPDGMHMDHFVCNNPICCNPEHVRPVSVRENVLRSASVAAVYAAKTHCKRGHPLDGDNLAIEVTSGGRKVQRRCLTCHRASGRRTKARRRQERQQQREAA